MRNQIPSRQNYVVIRCVATEQCYALYIHVYDYSITHITVYTQICMSIQFQFNRSKKHCIVHILLYTV